MYSLQIAANRLPVPPCQRASNGTCCSVAPAAFPSDCFSKLTTRTRSHRPDPIMATPVLAATPPAFPDV